MRCAGYCTAKSYNLDGVQEYLSGKFEVNKFKDFIYIKVPFKNNEDNNNHIFCYNYGVLVFWGFSPTDEKKYVKDFNKYTESKNSSLVLDEFEYSFSAENSVKNDHIYLDKNNLKNMIAISYGISQSIKLESFEVKIDKTIKESENLPKQLAKKGKLFLSRKDISKRIGELFIDKHSINLHTDILDSPDYFWEHPEVEPFYIKICDYLSLKPRIEILNKRVDILHELFELLSGFLSEKHSLKLEWAIIILIMVEVVFSFLEYFHHIGLLHS